MATSPDAASPLLVWDFENVMSDRGMSVAVGVPSEPQAISGFVSQTGGGPAELWGETGYVFLTRQLGSNEMFLWFTVTQPMFFAGLTFQHWHNHNPGFPTHPRYSVQLQLDTGDGYENVGASLQLSNDNSGGTDTIEVGRELEPGSYKLRWHPKGLKLKARDTSSEFFAIKHLTLDGRVLAGAKPQAASEVAPTPCAMPAPPPSAPKTKIGDFISVEINGTTVEKLKVMESKYGGKCSRTGDPFDAGATIAFKHRDALTDEQKAAIFGTKRAAHLMVLIPSAEETAASGEPVCCTPDAARLAIFRSAIRRGSRRKEWQYANLSSQSVAYSCGCLTRKDHPLDHKHDPAELKLCNRLARDAASHLRPIRLNDEDEGARFESYFAAAVIGGVVSTEITVALIRAVFGGAINPDTSVEIIPMEKVRGKWPRMQDSHAAPATEAKEAKAWDDFGKWFTAVPGLRAHAFVRIGASDEEPGAVMPRLVVALTEAGSLVGAASSVVYA